MGKRAMLVALLALLPVFGFLAGQAEAQPNRFDSFIDDAGYACETWREGEYGHLFCTHPTMTETDGRASYYECWLQKRAIHLELGCRGSGATPWRQAVPIGWWE